MPDPATDPAVVDSPPPHDPYAALRLRDYRFYALGHIASFLGTQMVAVAVGWELYQRTGSATALGLVGFFQFIPLLLLAIPAGQLVDRHDRRQIALVSQVLLTIASVALCVASLLHGRIPNLGILQAANDATARLAAALGETGTAFTDPYVPLLYLILFANGLVRTVIQPAKSALLPMIVPGNRFANAVTWNSSSQVLCAMLGPTLGGGIIAYMLASPARELWAYSTVYLLNAGFQLVQMLCLLPIRVVRPPQAKEVISAASLFAGLGFVWRTKVLLAVLSIDFFAVVLGGATALLPVFAKDILHVGPMGLGWLRAAPSIGAVCTAMVIAHRPTMKRAGRNLFLSVAGFGVATIVFGLSRSFWLSMAMLLLTGVFDNVSVVIRHTLVQLRTPDHVRGRVSAVNGIFIGSSNQLGALESGFAAAAFGAVASVVIGGVGTIVVVLAAAALWPAVWRLGRLEDDEEGPVRH